MVGLQDSTGYGMILFTPDAGETWVRQGQGSAALHGIDLHDIWAVDENNVWATGSKNSILRTIDGGQTWTSVTAPSNIPDLGLFPICIVNKTNIWIGGNYGVNNVLVYKSIDNGTNWTMLDTAFFSNVNSQGLWAVGPDIVYVSGSTQQGIKQRYSLLIPMVVEQHGTPSLQRICTMIGKGLALLLPEIRLFVMVIKQII